MKDLCTLLPYKSFTIKKEIGNKNYNGNRVYSATSESEIKKFIDDLTGTITEDKVREEVTKALDKKYKNTDYTYKIVDINICDSDFYIYEVIYVNTLHTVYRVKKDKMTNTLYEELLTSNLHSELL